MEEQIGWLSAREPRLAEMLAAIRDQEVEHLHKAMAVSGTRPRWLDALVAAATEALVWLSTYGASGRLHRAMR